MKIRRELVRISFERAFVSDASIERTIRRRGLVTERFHGDDIDE
jgi:hypothetical protein